MGDQKAGISPNTSLLIVREPLIKELIHKVRTPSTDNYANYFEKSTGNSMVGGVGTLEVVIKHASTAGSINGKYNKTAGLTNRTYTGIENYTGNGSCGLDNWSRIV